jgi:hypothetical protein
MEVELGFCRTVAQKLGDRKLQHVKNLILMGCSDDVVVVGGDKFLSASIYIYIHIFVAEIIRVLGGRRQRRLEIRCMVFLEEQEEGAQSLGKKTSLAK